MKSIIYLLLGYFPKPNIRHSSQHSIDSGWICGVMNKQHIFGNTEIQLASIPYETTTLMLIHCNTCTRIAVYAHCIIDMLSGI